MALSDDNEDNDNLSIVDIDTSLSESAIKLEDTTLGNGYLAKENIQLKKVEEEVEQEVLPIEEISSEDLDEGIELYKDESIVNTWGSWQSFHDAYQFFGVPAHYFDCDNNLMIDDSGWHTDYYCPFGIAVYLANNGNDALWIKGGCGMAGGQVNGQKFCAFEYGSNPINPIGFCHGDGSWQTTLTVNSGAKLSLNGGAISKPNGVGRNLENYGIVEIENHSMDNSTPNHKPDCIIYNSGTLTMKNGALRASVDLGSFSEYGIKNYGTVTLDRANVYSRSDTGILNSGRCQISNGSDIHGNVAIHHNSTSSEINIENSRVLGGTTGIENVSPQRIFIDNSNIQGSAYGIYQHGNSSSLCDIRGDSTYIHTDSKNFLESAIRADAGKIVVEGGQLYNSAIGIWNTGAQVYSSGGWIHDNNIGWACDGGRNEVVQKFNTNYGYRYSDVYNAFGNNWIIWYSHWLSNGLNEGRYGGTGNSTLITANSDGVKIGGWNTFVNRNCYNNNANYNGIYDNPTCIHITDNAHTTLSKVNAHNENTAWSNGVLVQIGSTATINNCILSHNWVDLNNADSNCSVTTSGSTFSDGITGINNKGTLSLNSGNISSNVSGIDNSGTLSLKNGSISSNTGTGVNNSGTLTMDNGTISGNKTGIDNGYSASKTSAKLTMTGGTIKDNTKWWGIVNGGTVVQSGGTLSGNNCTDNKLQADEYAGIYQGGNYYISGDARLDKTYLASEKVIGVSGKMNNADTITVTTYRTDRQVEDRKLVYFPTVFISNKGENPVVTAFENPSNNCSDVGGGAFDGRDKSAFGQSAISLHDGATRRDAGYILVGAWYTLTICDEFEVTENNPEGIVQEVPFKFYTEFTIPKN